MTEFLELDGGRIAYDVEGAGPLVVLSHGMGDHRQVFRFLAPLLAGAGYRVATPDLRGHGESSMNWTSHDGSAAISRTDIAGDLLGLIRHLGGPAVIVGHSISGGAATIAAAMSPELVRGVIEINPFTRTQPLLDFGALFTVSRYRRGQPRILGTAIFRSLGLWLSYLDVAYPLGTPDYDEYMGDLAAKLREPGRFANFLETMKSTPADAEAQLPHIDCPALVIMGTEDPDFPDPRAEAEAIVAAMPKGLGSVAMIEGSGHYPHAETPDQIAELALKFLETITPQGD
ncbi:alpha/beta fold hydrolase [Nocardia sp. ET3-3]|uniref:Alpha/beta fold hydrolase n=1 Tax=Nocardia terrae TaxID=2675851 RepID=A0A7K1UR72_9NOCA|nr:alpha/beta hydrolase [Nocardia terrae]MVU76845.1 alpha/beta fold hydrolase [Nocardia terrae]